MTDRDGALIERVRAFARDHVAPRALVWERDRTSCEETLRAAVRAGFGGVLLGEREGGLDLPVVTAAGVFEELAAVHLPFAFSLVVHANLTRAVGRLASQAQRRQWLPRLLSGDAIGAFCLTEPGAGSDPAAITTRAALTGIDACDITAPVSSSGAVWRLRGEKAWVTNGVFADVASVYAQSEPGRGARGVVALLVDVRAAGIDRVPSPMLLGGHAMGVSGLRFDTAVDEGALLAPAGEGFKAAMGGIDLARVLLAAMCCGMLRASLDEAAAYAGDRRAFGRPIAEFQGLQWSLADVATDLAAARALTQEAARALDAGADAVMLAAHAKKFATRVALTGVTTCMRAMGAVALREDSALARHLASAQIAEYLDGTTGIQNVVIARRLFGA